MSGELESYAQSPAEMEIEFGSYPEEIRKSALEYARGLRLAVQADPLPDGEEPQFVIVGVEQAGRSLLFASTSVTEARFSRRMEGFDRVPIRPGGPVARIPRFAIVVGAKMTGFQQVVADNYVSGLATLLGEMRRQLESGER